MADVADQLFTAGQEISTGKVEQGAADHVMGLVSKMQNVATQRAQIEEAKQKMEEAKLAKFVDALDKGKTFKGAARNNYYQKFMPRMRDSLGLTEKFPDESLAFMTSDEENLHRVSRIVALVNEGKMEGSRALEIVNDPVKFAQYSGLPLSQTSAPLSEEEMAQIQEAGKFAVGESGKTARTIRTGQDAASRLERNIEATGEKAIASKAGADFVEWQDAKSGVDSSLVKLDRAVEKLREGEVETGTKLLKAVSFWDAAQDLTHEDVASVRDDIRGAIQSSLKAIMGAQFTENEAIAMFNRAFNPRLSNKENVQRAQTEIDTLRKKIAAKDKLFARQGFSQKSIPVNPEGSGQVTTNPATVKVAADYLKQGRTPDEIANVLKKRGKSDQEIQAILKAAGGQ